MMTSGSLSQQLRRRDLEECGLCQWRHHDQTKQSVRLRRLIRESRFVVLLALDEGLDHFSPIPAWFERPMAGQPCKAY